MTRPSCVVAVITCTVGSGCGRIGFDCIRCGEDAAVLVTTTTAESRTEQAAVFSFPHVVSSGSDRVLVVGASLLADTDTFASVSFGTEPLTEILNVRGRPSFASMWLMVAPPVGTFDITLTITGQQELTVIAMSFEGVDQLDPIADLGGAGQPAAASATQQTLATSATDVLVDFFTLANGAGTSMPGSPDQLERARVTYSGTSDITSTSSTAPASTPSSEIGWTFDAPAAAWAHIAIALRRATSDL